MRRRIASAGPLASQSLSSDRRFLRLFEPHPSTPPNIRSVRRDKDPCATLAGTVLSQTLTIHDDRSNCARPDLAVAFPLSPSDGERAVQASVLTIYTSLAVFAQQEENRKDGGEFQERSLNSE